jgi:hypothetical protein
MVDEELAVGGSGREKTSLMLMLSDPYTRAKRSRMIRPLWSKIHDEDWGFFNSSLSEDVETKIEPSDMRVSVVVLVVVLLGIPREEEGARLPTPPRPAVLPAPSSSSK